MAVTERKIRGFAVADGEKGCGSGKEMGSSHRWATTVRSLTQDCGSGDVKETVICPTPGLPAGSSGPELPSRVCPPPSLSRRPESVPRLPPGRGKPLRNFNPECLLGNMRLFNVDLSSDFINSYECEVSDTNYNSMERLEDHPVVSNGKKTEDYESGSSEELVYGPGIVKKLKKKYLSLTLRENQRQRVRPSLNNLRRATSLENILDEEPKISPPKAQMYFKKNGINGTASRNSKVSQYCARYMSNNRGSESIMKKAQSMDTLFRNEVKTSPCTLPKSLTVESCLSNGNDVVIIDRVPPQPKPPAKPEVAKDLPPPDVVRQTLKIFEKSSPSPRKPDVRITKVKAVKVVQERPKPVVEKRRPNVKPIVLPKPKLPAERLMKRDIIMCSSPITAPTKQNDVFVFVKTVEAPDLSPISVSKWPEQPRLAEATNTVVVQESVVQSTIIQSTVVQTPVTPPPVAQRPLATFDSPKQVAAVRPVVRKSPPRPPSPPAAPPPVPQTPPLTHVEIEKNHINRTRTEPPPAVDDSPKITLWDSKAWNGQNTMVFDFSNRKDIPDYIENDGLVVPSKKDKKVNGDLSIEEDDLVDSPLSCTVNIIGGNIVINGKSNLRKQPKQQKLRIQFDNAAPALYEYPREDGSPVILSPTKNHLPPTGGNLCSYTPSKTVDRFELGVSRSPPIPSTKNSDSSPIADPPPPWSSHESTSDILF